MPLIIKTHCLAHEHMLKCQVKSVNQSLTEITKAKNVPEIMMAKIVMMKVMQIFSKTNQMSKKSNRRQKKWRIKSQLIKTSISKK